MEVFANFIGIITHLNGKYRRFLDGLTLPTSVRKKPTHIQAHLVFCQHTDQNKKPKELEFSQRTKKNKKVVPYIEKCP
jgi:hypothetical protein